MELHGTNCYCLHCQALWLNEDNTIDPANQINHTNNSFKLQVFIVHGSTESPSAMFWMTRMKYANMCKNIFQRNMCAPSFLVCARLTTCVRAQLRGNIARLPQRL